MFSDSVFVVGRNNSNLADNWPVKMADIWNETDHKEKINLLGQKVKFCWHVYGGAKTIEPARYITETDLEKSSNRILFMSMFNDFGW